MKTHEIRTTISGDANEFMQAAERAQATIQRLIRINVLQRKRDRLLRIRKRRRTWVNFFMLIKAEYELHNALHAR